MIPEISVILPFFNAEQTLGKAIESILNQTFTDFELLLVDNNSSDNSFSIAQSFLNGDKRIKILRENSVGVANAMNCGLQNANGNFIARMDADDISYPERLEKQHRFLKENPETGFLGSEVVYVSHNKNTAGFKRFVKWVNSFHSSEEIKLNRFVEIPVVNPTIMFRKEIYLKYGGCLDADIPEDYEMQLRYLEAGVQMAKLKEPLLEWHDFSTRLTRTDERYSTDAFLKVKAKYFRKWSEENNWFHPNVWIWGAGRKTRQRTKFLKEEGIGIGGFIDIVTSKTTKKEVIHFEKIPDRGKIFIVSMVTNSGAGRKIREFLCDKSYIEGKDFVLMG